MTQNPKGGCLGTVIAHIQEQVKQEAREKDVDNSPLKIQRRTLGNLFFFFHVLFTLVI